MVVNLKDQITLLQLDDGQAATGVPLGQLAQQCDCLSSESCENFWLPVEEFVNQSSSNSLLQRWVGHAATQLRHNKVTPLDCALLSGVEYWVQVAPPHLCTVQASVYGGSVASLSCCLATLSTCASEDRAHTITGIAGTSITLKRIHNLCEAT